MAESKTTWVRMASLWKTAIRTGDNAGQMKLISQNLHNFNDTSDSDVGEEDEQNDLRLHIFNNERKKGFMDSGHDATLAIRRDDLDEFIKYLEGLK